MGCIFLVPLRRQSLILATSGLITRPGIRIGCRGYNSRGDGSTTCSTNRVRRPAMQCSARLSLLLRDLGAHSKHRTLTCPLPQSRTSYFSSASSSRQTQQSSETVVSSRCVNRPPNPHNEDTPFVCVQPQAGTVLFRSNNGLLLLCEPIQRSKTTAVFILVGVCVR